MTYWKVLLKHVSLLCGLTQPTPADTFSFTRKVSKSVSKGLPLRYPLGQVTVKAGGANQNDAPSP